MYEELVKELRKESCGAKTTSWWRAADAIEKLVLELDKASNYDSKTSWIPVTERLPKSETEVLITDGKHINKAYFSEHDGRCSFTFIDSGRIPNGYDEGATHWMPLPEPPKEETE